MATNVLNQVISDRFAMYHGDSCEVLKGIPTGTLHYSIFSPPFASLYTYSASDRDLGNCEGYGEFFKHLEFIAGELFRATMPGRLLSFHCMDLPTSKVRDGFIGIRDFRGDLVRIFESFGWILHSQVVIWKDPVTAMQRTKALGLLHKQIKKDSCMSRQGIPDYLVTMRKPGDNPERVTHTNESFSIDDWQKLASPIYGEDLPGDVWRPGQFVEREAKTIADNYAEPVWMDINPSNTLQYRSARTDEDERHICPLQLEVINRALRLWTNPDDVVLSPFAGIGSEGYCALKMGRRFIGIELKESYYGQAVRNLSNAAAVENESTLWDSASIQ